MKVFLDAYSTTIDEFHLLLWFSDDIMLRANQSHETGPNSRNYFLGSGYRQYGSGFGAAVKASLKGFVIPMVKTYGIPVA